MEDRNTNISHQILHRCLLLATMGFLMIAHAVSQPFQFKNYGVEDGLSHNFITSIYQDKEGFMWFGSLSGLDRFDGTTFKHYYRDDNDPNAIHGELIMTIYEDVINKRLWIGAEKGGLQLFDKRQQRVRHFPLPDNQDTLKRYHVYSIEPQQNGDFWLGTDRGLQHFDTRKLVFDTYNLTPEIPKAFKNTITKSVFIDKEQNLWLGTSSGLYVRKKDALRFRPLPIPWVTPSNKEILDIKQSPSGNLLIGTYANGLCIVNPLTEAIKVLLPEVDNKTSYTTREITLAADGTFWVGSRIGFFVFNEQTLKFAKYSNDPDRPTTIPHNSTLAFCKDTKGDMWIGTRLGVSHWVSEHQTFDFIPSKQNNNKCLNSPSVFCILQKDSLIYIATESGGVNILNSNSKTFTYLTDHADGLPAIGTTNIKCIVSGKEDEIWIGTFLMGISVYNTKTNTVKQYLKHPNYKKYKSLPDDRIYALLSDNKKRIWVGTGSGLVRYNEENDNFDDFYTNISTSSYINWIYQDKASSIWVGGTDSVFVFDGQTDALIKTIPTNVTTRSMLEDSEGRIWFTTTGKGFVEYDKENGTFKYISKQQGLSSNLTYSAVEDDMGNIWIGSDNALNKYSPKTNQIKIYYKDDGHQISQFNYNSTAKLDNGKLAFGGVNGLLFFDPQKIHDITFVPPVVFSSLSVLNNKSAPTTNSTANYDINYCDTLILSSNLNFITISFAALSYANPQKNQLAYKMEGIDNDWILANGNNQATYTQIAPGHYIFKVKGSNNSGVWNPEAKQILIIVTPPFYQTWWFKTIWLFATIALFFVVVYIRTNANRKQRLLLERMVKEKTTDLEKSKTEIQKQNLSLTRLSEQISNKNQQLANYAEQLESKVKSRTHELELAKTRAEESDRLKSAFLANMSHEIRTPMNGILGFTDLLKEDELTLDERIMFVQVIEQSGQRMLNIINDLIDISKIEANQMAIRLADIPVSAVMQELQLFFEPSAEKKGLKINTKCENILPTTVLVSDKDKLMQILTNLVNNAIKFTEKGQIDITCQLGPNHITFMIKDSGIGIAPDVQPLLFKRFAQGDSAMNKKFEGAGLGLYICKSLTEMIGGRIWLESEKEKGSTFYVQLTLK